jgi:hypothetical protein
MYDRSVPHNVGGSKKRKMRSERRNHMKSSIGPFEPRRTSELWDVGQCNEAANFPKLLPPCPPDITLEDRCIKCNKIVTMTMKTSKRWDKMPMCGYCQQLAQKAVDIHRPMAIVDYSEPYRAGTSLPECHLTPLDDDMKRYESYASPSFVSGLSCYENETIR